MVFIATITFNRPDQLNAPTIGARRRYGDLIYKASLDDDVKVLVIRGEGADLGSGADLDELMAKRMGDEALREEFGLTDEDDVTLPPPEALTESLRWTSSKRAVTDRAAVIETVQVPVPEQAPVQPAKTIVALLGVAVRVTLVP